ncbi:MAG: hypothetical protein Q9209_004716 [Squamulea sp. 1 TL-2023]
MGESCSSSDATGRLCRSICNFEIKYALISENSPLANPKGTTTPRVPNKQYREAHFKFAKAMDTILLAPIDRCATEGTLGEVSPALLAAMNAVVLHQSQNYLASVSERDETATYSLLYSQISKLKHARHYTVQELVDIQTQIEYRSNLMRLADFYVSALGLHEEVWADAIEELVAVKAKAIEDQVEILSQFEIVKEAGQKFFSALGRR